MSVKNSGISASCAFKRKVTGNEEVDGCRNVETIVPWKEVCAVADVKLWSTLLLAAVENTFSLHWTCQTAHQTIIKAQFY